MTRDKYRKTGHYEDGTGMSLYELVVGSIPRPKPPQRPSVLIPIDVAAPGLEVPAQLKLHSGHDFCIEGSAHASRGPSGVRPLTDPSINLHNRLVETVSSYFGPCSGVFASFLLQKGLLQGRRRSAPIHHIVKAVRTATGGENAFPSFNEFFREIEHLSAVEYTESIDFGMSIPHQFFSIFTVRNPDLNIGNHILTWAMYIPVR